MGGLASHGMYSIEELFLAATLGAILGDAVSYELGRKGNAPVERWSFLKRQLEKGKPFFEKHKGKSIFLGRFIGWLRPIVPFLAGLVQMRRPHFYLVNAISAVAWAISYLGLGYIFGAAWKLAFLWATRAGLVLFIIVALAIIFAWFWRWAVRNGHKAYSVVVSINQSIYSALKENPYIQTWAKKHDSALTFIRKRVSIQSFFGLPLTLLGLAFITSVIMLSGIVEDYLTGDPLALSDPRIANLLYAFRNSKLLHFFYAITLFAEAEIIIGAVFIFTALFWYYRKRVYILTLWVTIAGSQAVTILGKFVFHRSRPEGVIPAILEDSYSFPSGHATSAMAFYGFLAYFYIRIHPSWRVKMGALFGALTVISAIDLSRMYLGVHYLSDVLAGNMVGLTTLLFAISITEWLRWNKKTASATSAVPSEVWVIIIPMLVTAHLTLFSTPWKEAARSIQPIKINNSDVLNLFEKNRLPRYTETLIGTAQEPLNLILIGKEECVLDVFRQAQWEKAEKVSFSSTLKFLKMAIKNDPYSRASITPSFYNSFPHDIGLQKATDTNSVRARHHARLWKINYETSSGVIFVGAASLDTGIKWGITHSIDPAVDVERDLLISDLERTGMITQVERVPFVSSGLGKNFTGDQFFTDGKLVIITFKACP